MDLQLGDKTALVTGSTAGIGLEIARTLAVEGAGVIITGRNQQKLDRALASIRASDGADVRGILADPTRHLARSAERTKGTRVTVNAVLPGPTRSEGIVGF